MYFLQHLAILENVIGLKEIQIFSVFKHSFDCMAFRTAPQSAAFSWAIVANCNAT